jgi:hypothetical protein
MLTGLPEEAVTDLLAAAGPDAGSSLLMAELRQLGGALSRPHPGGGALSHLEGMFLLFGVAVAATPELAAQGEADARRLVSDLSPYAADGHYLNFTERRVDASRSYTDEAWRRLTQVRSDVDPAGLIVATHPVPRLYGQEA